MTRKAEHHALVFLAALVVALSGCSERFGEIGPDEVRAYRIPTKRAAGPADSTLTLVSVPAGYKPDRSWPAVIALHGYGSSAARFHLVWREAAATSGFVLITPQGEDPTDEGIGWSWGRHAEETVRLSLEAAMRSVRIDRSRIFLAGFSQGGTLTYRLALSHPHMFRGIAPIGAGRELPESGRLDLTSGMRVYIGHGELEPHLEEVRGLAARLDSAGARVLLREYAGVGHGLPDSATAELKILLAFLGADGQELR